MWDKMMEWTAGATVWDWIWHIIAVVLVVIFSIPQICVPLMKKIFGKKKTDEDNDQMTDSQNQNA